MNMRTTTTISLFDRMTKYIIVAIQTGNRTPNPMNAVRLMEEAQERIIALANAVVELSENVTDRDGLSNEAEIMVDIAREVLDDLRKLDDLREDTALAQVRAIVDESKPDNFELTPIGKEGW
jgi:hypothetical protein